MNVQLKKRLTENDKKEEKLMVAETAIFLSKLEIKSGGWALQATSFEIFILYRIKQIFATSVR